MTTGPLQIQPDIRREGPAETDWARIHQKKTKGEGRGKPGGSGPNRKHPSHQGKQKRRRPPHQHHRTAATKERSPAAPRKENHTTRSAQAMANQNRDIQPARDARPRGTDPNTVCGQTHPHSKPKLEAEVVKVRAKLECACLPAGKHTVKRVSALRIKTLSKGGNKPRGGG